MAEAFPARPRAPGEFLVMIVDDEEAIRALVEYNLKKDGFRTVGAVDGNDAFAKLEPDAPDLIVLDLMMPGQSGFEFLRRLQATEHARIPVVIATARSLDSTTVDVLLHEANVIKFFTKPFNWPEILGAIHARLRTQPALPPAKPAD